MSSSKLTDLLCKGQHDIDPNENHKTSTGSSENSSRKGLASFMVSVTVMRRRRTSPQVLLKASITTVLVVTIGFIVLYTILLKYFSNTVPYVPEEWERIRSQFHTHHRPKLIPRPMDLDPSDYVTSEIKYRPPKWNISNYDFNNNLDNTKLCRQKFQYLVIIVSTRTEFERRIAIRNSWCRPQRYNLPSDAWGCVFLLGVGSQQEPNRETVDQRIDLEIKTYNDILKGSYIDSYRNLTYKVLHGLHWASRSCPTEFVLKTDDDCFVNTHLLHILILHHRDAMNLYIGSVSSKQHEVLRDPNSVWYVSEELYAENFYPRYASGAGYLLSSDVVTRLIDVSRYRIPIPNEDAYIGILAQDIDVKPLQSGRFTLMSIGWTLCNYLYLVVIHKVLPDQQEDMLNNTIRARTSHLCTPTPNEQRLTWN
ncbi:beta-1,3-galactosyltransferase 1-like [Ylistrum balloti]|uniref:beta-1,3-galactosyltransferase 1-like n=1 Tax=Ylistrum balloti TaxID=509963 RepID=UPI002905E4B9|nr:beta-1,3-galactosyltransferase 1-like [Ylistrum balloti]